MEQHDDSLHDHMGIAMAPTLYTKRTPRVAPHERSLSNSYRYGLGISLGLSSMQLSNIERTGLQYWTGLQYCTGLQYKNGSTSWQLDDIAHAQVRNQSIHYE